MGLDMYLNRETYVKRWKRHDKDKLHTVTVLRGEEPRKEYNRTNT